MKINILPKRVKKGFIKSVNPFLWRRETVLSKCEKYRYQLWRQTGPYDPDNSSAYKFILFIGLNPSTADATLDDPTVRRLKGFAARQGYTQMALVNLYAYRSTDPKGLLNVSSPVGGMNDRYILHCAVHADKIVCCWGNGLIDERRSVEVRYGILKNFKHKCFVFGFTKNDQPKHPLYLSKDTPTIPLYRL